MLQPQIPSKLYNQMQKQGPPLDKYTFPFLLKACSTLPSLHKGQETHCQVIKHGFHTDIFVQNSLINLYGSNADIKTATRIFDMFERDVATWTTLVTCYVNFASIESARQLFDDMPMRNIISFSAMIADYVRRDLFKEALRLFHDLQIAKMEPNGSILVSVLCACASLGDLDSGRWIHSYIMRKIRTNLIVELLLL
ncbi:pentatricopeptide repeat-containing protein At2g20540-like [Tasmannia lanceolata]|uniref:pentatricopeptide repeat-containing protein At2g20540-like n=1 Tax=Tasmannia lanceolata TaxID=3420 RepID=UPI0040639555